MRALRRFLARLGGTAALPEDFTGTLTNDEYVVAAADAKDGSLVATHLGLWLPEAEGHRRVGWHLVSKATWNAGAFVVTEADEVDEADGAVLLRDRPPRRFTLTSPGKLPEVVRERVTASIKSTHHRDLAGGGAWFVQRKVPGRDGIVLQVRADAGTDDEALRAFAAQIAAELRKAKRAG